LSFPIFSDIHLCNYTETIILLRLTEYWWIFTNIQRLRRIIVKYTSIRGQQPRHTHTWYIYYTYFSHVKKNQLFIFRNLRFLVPKFYTKAQRGRETIPLTRKYQDPTDFIRIEKKPDKMQPTFRIKSPRCFWFAWGSCTL
jgi:hypothetical protein